MVGLTAVFNDSTITLTIRHPRTGVFATVKGDEITEICRFPDASCVEE